MLDVIIRGGEIVDGTGRRPYRSDVGVRDGRIVALGPIDEPAASVFDAADLIVAPGFIDIHTHYDAQAFWDPTLGPSPLHGVTSVIGGNCGFSIAPLRPGTADYLMRMLARVEGMPVGSLQSGVPWDWSSTAEFLDRLEGRLTPNTAWMTGHSALRCAAMGEESKASVVTEEQLGLMCSLLAQGLEAGAIGLSSSWSRTHNDHLGEPVPSRSAGLAELLALCEVVGRFDGTSLEMIPGSGRFDDIMFEAMARMSATANRPINWNAIMVEDCDDEMIEHQLSADAFAATLGGRVVALTAPDTRHHRLNFLSGFVLDALPGWGPLMALPPVDRLRALRDPQTRAALDRGAQTATGFLRDFVDWSSYILVEVFVEQYRNLCGMTVRQAAERLGQSPWDALIEIVIADELKTVITKEDSGQDRRTWERRVALWRDSRAMVGASDAGAHIDMTDAFSYCTVLLQRAVRDFGLLPIEEAIALLTGKPAALYGLVDRGVVKEGASADLVVLDPQTVAPQPVVTRFDLPGGAPRLYSAADGIEHVFVAGVEAVRGSEFTDARPGRVLRRGVDTMATQARPRP